MKKYNILLILSVLLFSSCLKSDWEDQIYSTECELTNVEFEYRWTVAVVDGVEALKFKSMSLKKNIDRESQTVTIEITVPAAGGDFTEEIREQVNLTNLACLWTVSTGASVRPLDGAPRLGAPGDYSQPRKYRITSASGEYKDWTLVTTLK